MNLAPKMDTITPLLTIDPQTTSPNEQVLLGLDHEGLLWRGVFSRTQHGPTKVNGIAWTRLYSWVEI